MQWVMRGLTWLGAFLAGAVFGVAGTIMHASLVLSTRRLPFDIPLPLGLIIAAAGCLALLIAVRCLAEDRVAVFATGLGMFVALMIFSGAGPGGSVVVPQPAAGEPPLGMIWAWVLAAVIVAVVAWPDLSRIRAAQRAQASSR